MKYSLHAFDTTGFADTRSGNASGNDAHFPNCLIHRMTRGENPPLQMGLYIGCVKARRRAQGQPASRPLAALQGCQPGTIGRRVLRVEQSARKSLFRAVPCFRHLNLRGMVQRSLFLQSGRDASRNQLLHKPISRFTVRSSTDQRRAISG